MSEGRIVIGGGPDALRAAWALAETGASVTLLVDATGPVDEMAGAAERAVALGGRIARLPMRRRDLLRLLGEHAPSLLASHARARLERRRRQLAGLGQEERTYEDWVVRRMGRSAHDLLYAAYARHRFGAPTSELSVSVARLHHGRVPPERTEAIAAQAVETRHATVRRLVVDGGHVAGVELEDGEVIANASQIWIARSPATVARWLGDAFAAELRVDAQRLEADAIVETALEGNADDLPEEVHVLDREAPFFLVRRRAGGAVFTSRGAAPDARQVADAAARLGLGSFSGGTVQIHPDSAPRWLAGTHARLRRVLEAYDALGIAGVGRAGAMSLVDTATEVAFARALARGEASQRELHRRYLDPPVKVDDLDAELRRFVER